MLYKSLQSIQTQTTEYRRAVPQSAVHKNKKMKLHSAWKAEIENQFFSASSDRATSERPPDSALKCVHVSVHHPASPFQSFNAKFLQRPSETFSVGWLIVWWRQHKAVKAASFIWLECQTELRFTKNKMWDEWVMSYQRITVTVTAYIRTSFIASVTVVWSITTWTHKIERGKQANKSSVGWINLHQLRWRFLLLFDIAHYDTLK